MGRRIKACKINKKYLFIAVAIAVVSLGVALLTSLTITSCRNPLMNIIESSGITVKVDGKAIQPDSVYDLGPVKRDSSYSAIVTILNSGNLNLKLTGDPLVSIIADPTTVSMFNIEPQPSNIINVKGSTEFTLEYNPVGADAERAIQLLIKNNSKKEDFSFDLTSLIDGTAPTVKEDTGVPQVYPANNDENISTNVTVSAIFSEEMDPDTITTTSFTLTEDPDGAAIPVNATVSYDSDTDTAFLDPIPFLKDSTEYEVTLFNTITDLAGNPMVFSYSWSFTTGVGIVDSNPPEVKSTVPANNATGVALNSVISATFNEPLDSSTAKNIDNFIVVDTTAVEGTLSYDDPTRTITFTPKNPLSPLTTYTAQLTTGIRDAAQNPLASTYEWTFTTEEGVDTTGPAVVGRSPANGAPDVATNIVITAEFDELLDPETIDDTTFKLTKLTGSPTGPVMGDVVYNAYSKTATFIPDSPLSEIVQYRATLTTDIEDIVGNPLASEDQWFFTTGSLPDSTAPTVDSTNPSNGGTGALLYGNTTATFDESMDPSTINDTTFKLYQDANQIAGTVSYSESTKTATFDPTPMLDETTVYTAKVVGGISGVTDAAGNPLAADEEWKFTTEAGTTNPKLVVETLDPPNKAAGVYIATTIQVEFSKMMDPFTITAGTFLVSEIGTGDPVTAALISYNETTRIAIFTPSADLEYLTDYEVVCTSGMTDIGGNTLVLPGPDFTYTFTTMPDNIWDSMKWDVGKWAP